MARSKNIGYFGNLVNEATSAVIMEEDRIEKLSSEEKKEAIEKYDHALKYLKILSNRMENYLKEVKG